MRGAVGKRPIVGGELSSTLKLPQEVLAGLGSGLRSMGHARALLGPDDAAQLRVSRGCDRSSVRETEALVKKVTQPRRKGP